MKSDAAMDLMKELIAEMNISSPTASVTEAASLRNDLGLNSLNLLILLVRIQERTGVEFATQTNSVANFQTVGDVLRVLAPNT